MSECEPMYGHKDCTPWDAATCSVHGDCTCDRLKDFSAIGECPLHKTSSGHMVNEYGVFRNLPKAPPPADPPVIAQRSGFRKEIAMSERERLMISIPDDEQPARTILSALWELDMGKDEEDQDQNYEYQARFIARALQSEEPKE